MPGFKETTETEVQKAIFENAKRIFQNNPQALAQFNDDKGKFSSTKFESYLKEKYGANATAIMEKMKKQMEKKEQDHFASILSLAQEKLRYDSDPSFRKSYEEEYTKPGVIDRFKHLEVALAGTETKEEHGYGSATDDPHFASFDYQQKEAAIRFSHGRIPKENVLKDFKTDDDRRKLSFHEVKRHTHEEDFAKNAGSHAHDINRAENPAALHNLAMRSESKGGLGFNVNTWDKIIGTVSSSLGFSASFIMASAMIPQRQRDMAIVQRQFAAEQLRAIDDFIKGLIGEAGYISSVTLKANFIFRGVYHGFC